MKIWINMHIYDIFHGRIIQPIDNLWKTNEPTIKSKQHLWTRHCTKTHPSPQLLLQKFWIIIIGTFWRLMCSVDCIRTRWCHQKEWWKCYEVVFYGSCAMKIPMVVFFWFFGVQKFGLKCWMEGEEPEVVIRRYFLINRLYKLHTFCSSFFLSFTTQSQTAKRWVSDRSRPQMERDTERKK